MTINFKPKRTAPLVLRFGRNTAGRDLLVGDIHGHFSKLQAALDAVGFDPSAGDRLFSVGDLVDRGPESMLALEWVHRPWFHAVAGNHEDFAIRWPNGHMEAGNYAANGGAWNIANDPVTQRDFALAFADLPVAMELDTAAGLLGIVHADCPGSSWSDFVGALISPGLSNAERERLIDWAQWSRSRIKGATSTPLAVSGVRAVVVGHTPLTRPTWLANVLYIDTGAWLPGPHGDGEFCLIDAETLRAAEQPSTLRW